MFIAALFIIVKIWEQPKLTDKRSIKMWYIHMMKYYSAIKGTSIDICCNIGEIWKYSTKRKKWDTKGHILWDSAFMKCPEKTNL